MVDLRGTLQLTIHTIQGIFKILVIGIRVIGDFGASVENW
jgi:hypothetical protein